MTQPVFKDVATKEVQIDLGEMENDGESEINVYIISNRRIVPEKKRDKLIDLIMEVSTEHEEVVLITGLDDTSVSLGPKDPSKGPRDFKLYFQINEAVEATASKGEEIDLFLKDLFVRVQKLTNNLFCIFSYHDHIFYEKKGLFPSSSSNNDLPDDMKQFFPLEEYKKRKSEFPQMVKEIDKKLTEEE